jgi:hypothetical protein
MDGFNTLDETQETMKEIDEKKICAHVRNLVEERRSAASRIAHESIWMTNIAAILGFNGLTYNANMRQFQPVNRVASRGGSAPIKVNKILPTLQNRQAKLCKNPPRYEVRPESNDTQDKEAARLGIEILTWIWDKQNVDEKRLNLMMWIQQCGHSYLKCSWDSSLGNEMVNPETGELDYEGDVRVDVVSAFEVFPDPLAKTLDDASDVIQATVRKLDYFKLRYPEKGDKVEQEDAWLLSLQYEDTIKTINQRGPSNSGFAQSMKNCAIELVKYEKRSKDYPQGRMIVCANGVLLEDKPLPIGEIPFAKFDDIMVGGKYYSEAVTTHIRPIQDYNDDVIRKRADWTKKLLTGKLIAARGSGLSQESLNDQSGEVVYYDVVPNAPNGGAPTPLPMPTIPQYAYNEEERNDSMINYISGISDVSRGTIPSASIPALGMQILVEQDDSRIGVMVEQHERSYAKIGGMILKFVEKYYTMPRKLKIAGKNQTYLVKEVTGEMLRGNTDVIVIRGSTLPGSKVLRRQEVLNAFQQGLLGDPADPKVREQVLAHLEFGDIGAIWKDQSLDEFQVMLGIKLIEKGELPPAHKLDNHEFWILELNRYRKEKSGDLSIMTAALIETTINTHINFQLELSNALSDGPLPPAPPLPPRPQIAPELLMKAQQLNA